MKTPSIYIIQSENLIKLGYSSDVKHRLKQYYLHNPNTIILAIGSSEKSLEIEQYIHKKFKSLYAKEWYSIKMLNSFYGVLEKNNVKVKKYNTKYYELFKNVKCYSKCDSTKNVRASNNEFCKNSSSTLTDEALKKNMASIF